MKHAPERTQSTYKAFSTQPGTSGYMPPYKLPQWLGNREEMLQQIAKDIDYRIPFKQKDGAVVETTKEKKE